jgi:hypothetical protein
MQRSCKLVLHSIAVRHHTNGGEAENPFTEVEPELQLHERVVEAHTYMKVGLSYGHPSCSLAIRRVSL